MLKSLKKIISPRFFGHSRYGFFQKSPQFFRLPRFIRMCARPSRVWRLHRWTTWVFSLNLAPDQGRTTNTETRNPDHLKPATARHSLDQLTSKGIRYLYPILKINENKPRQRDEIYKKVVCLHQQTNKRPPGHNFKTLNNENKQSTNQHKKKKEKKRRRNTWSPCLFWRALFARVLHSTLNLKKKKQCIKT